MPEAKPGRRPSVVDVWAVERVPRGAEYTGLLRTPHARPLVAALGIALGLLCFFTFSPILAQALSALYWLALGRPGTFADTYGVLTRYEVPFGMVATQLGVALLIPISAALVLTLHHVRPTYLFSVRPGLRWRVVAVYLGVAFVTLNAVLAVGNALAGGRLEVRPQEGFAGFLVAILLTSPLQAAAEEVFFRGYLLQAFGSFSANHWVGIIASALIFAFLHGTQNLWLFGSRFAFGVLAAILVVRSGGLEAGIAAHVVNNVCAFVYAGLSTGIAQLKAVRDITPTDAVQEVVMYAVFTAAALAVARWLRLARRTGAPGLGETGSVR